MNVLQIKPVRSDTQEHQALLEAAAALEQTRYVLAREEPIRESILLGAFIQGQWVGFLRFVVQVIGSDAGRPPIELAGKPLLEGYVEAFGVLPEFRRRKIGQRMQEEAISICEAKGCYQIRSRSPVTSRENYALKLKMGYAIHPSEENDSYYFIKTLEG